MKVLPETWGPPMWLTIHIIALGYPVKPSYGDKKAAKEFFESLQFLIPCPQCREHYRSHLTKYHITPHLDRKEDLFKYTVMLHNEVNKSLNKPLFTEVEALLYIKRLGLRKESPIITKEMFEEIDMRSMIKGGFIGAAVTFITCVGIYYFSRNDR